MLQQIRLALRIGLVTAFGAPLVASSQTALQPVSDTIHPTASADSAPLVVQSPGTVEISIEIEPTAQTEELRVFADSGAFYRSTTIGLNGVASDRRHTFTWHGFPAGEYEVVGELVDADGQSEVVARGALLVIDRR